MVGAFMLGKGTVYVDDVVLYYQEKEEWIEIPIKNSDFEKPKIGDPSAECRWAGSSAGYAYKVSTTENKEGNSCAVIAYEGKFKESNGAALFEEAPKFGALIEKEIGKGVFCQIPLNLYANSEGTYPKLNSTSDLEKLLEATATDPNKLSVRLGNIVNTYNVFQHFYPYFDEVKVDWEKELVKALKQSYLDTSDEDHKITLEKMTAALRDGHISVRSNNYVRFTFGFRWELIEDKLIITEVKDEKLSLKVGDEVTKVNDLSTADYLAEMKSRISAGTNGYLNHRVKNATLIGKEGSEITIEVAGKTMTLKRDRKFDYRDSGIAIQEKPYQILDGNIYYLNLSTIEMEAINTLMPVLQQSNGIICDMRGYPNSNHDFISHLLTEKDTSKAWMRVPEILYPDQENLVGYEPHGWELEPKEPYLGDKKVVFITDGRAISYAESYMGFIEGYDLATIVGEPTAGTNGNVNPFRLLGNYSISWTGMKVVKHNGSQFHGIGILPDVYVNKTVEGVKAGKDEFLEKALEIVKK